MLTTAIPDNGLEIYRASYAVRSAITGSSKGTPGDAKCVTKILRGKNKEVRGDNVYIFVLRVLFSFYVKTILTDKTAQQTHKTRLHLLKMFKLQYCTKFAQLILRKIIKTVATRCHVFRLKCT